jgi:signal transduction histidine kinase
MEAGAIAVRLEDIELDGELTSLRAMFRALAPSPHVELVVEEPPEPVVLRTDRALLGQVLRNLVGNALKFTERGEVRVSVRRGDSADSGVTILISDTGIGIAPEDLGRVFEEWQRVNGDAPERVPGSGLGLPLVRRLAEALGGRVEVESELGRGSVFTVALPARNPVAEAP